MSEENSIQSDADRAEAQCDHLIDESMMSVCYRTGPLTKADYDEAIEALIAARDEDREGFIAGCVICSDSGHTAISCHHHPLLLAREWARATRIYVCYHCGFTATNDEEGLAHFGGHGQEFASCQSAPHSAEKYNRPTTEPGGCECLDCGRIFIGAEHHTKCGVCAASGDSTASPHDQRLIETIRTAVNAEREACASVADEYRHDGDWDQDACAAIATTIRQRGSK